MCVCVCTSMYHINVFTVLLSCVFVSLFHLSLYGSLHLFLQYHIHPWTNLSWRFDTWLLSQCFPGVCGKSQITREFLIFISTLRSHSLAGNAYRNLFRTVEGSTVGYWCNKSLRKHCMSHPWIHTGAVEGPRLHEALTCFQSNSVKEDHLI